MRSMNNSTPGASPRTQSTGSRRKSTPLACSLVTPSSRENVRANGNDKVLETTADTGDIQKILREINGQTPNLRMDQPYQNPTPAPATRSHQKPPQYPSRGVENKELSNLGSAKKKNDDMAAKDSRRLTVDACSLEALLRDCGQDDDLFSMQGGGQADRRATADFNLLAKLLEATPSPSAKSNARGMESEARRETADQDTLEKLLMEMQSPRLRGTPQGRAFAQILISSQSKSSDFMGNMSKTSESRRLTIDSSVLARLLQDSSMIKEGNDHQDPNSANNPEPQGAPQNVTADMSILCALLDSARKTAAGDGGDLIAMEDRGKDEAKESSAKKGKKANGSPQEQLPQPSAALSAPRKSPTPDHKRSREEKRRTTASPTSLAKLLEDLDDQPQTRPTLALSGKVSPIPKDSLALLHERSQHRNSPSLQRSSPNGASPMPQGLGDTGYGKKASHQSPRPQAQAARKAHTPFNSNMSPPPVPPRMASTDTKGKQALRSCLSTSKSFCPATSPRVRSEKKSVVFGSPDAAFFFKNSPSNSITPMAKNDVKRLFPQFEDLAHSEDESEMEETGVTAENSAILATWDEESDEEEADSSRKKRKLSRSPRPKRRDSLLPSSGGSSKSRSSLLSDDDEEENNMDLSRLNDSRLTLNDKLDMVAESETEVAMAANDLEEMTDIGEVSPQFRSSIDKSPGYGQTFANAAMDEGDHTVELEMTLGNMMENLKDTGFAGEKTDMLNFRLRTGHLNGSVFNELREDDTFDDDSLRAKALGVMETEDQTVELEDDLNALLANQIQGGQGRSARKPKASKNAEALGLVEPTLELEPNLQSLLMQTEGGGLQMERAVPGKNRFDGGLDIGSDSDDDTVEYEEAEEPDMRMSLDTDSPKSETGVSRVSFSQSRGRPSEWDPTDNPRFSGNLSFEANPSSPAAPMTDPKKSDHRFSLNTSKGTAGQLEGLDIDGKKANKEFQFDNSSKKAKDRYSSHSLSFSFSEDSAMPVSPRDSSVLSAKRNTESDKNDAEICSDESAKLFKRALDEDDSQERTLSSLTCSTGTLRQRERTTNEFFMSSTDDSSIDRTGKKSSLTSSEEFPSRPRSQMRKSTEDSENQRRRSTEDSAGRRRKSIEESFSPNKVLENIDWEPVLSMQEQPPTSTLLEVVESLSCEDVQEGSGLIFEALWMQLSSVTDERERAGSMLDSLKSSVLKQITEPTVAVTRSKKATMVTECTRLVEAALPVVKEDILALWSIREVEILKPVCGKISGAIEEAQKERFRIEEEISSGHERKQEVLQFQEERRLKLDQREKDIEEIRLKIAASEEELQELEVMIQKLSEEEETSSKALQEVKDRIELKEKQMRKVKDLETDIQDYVVHNSKLRAVREEAMILRGLHNMQPKELFSDQVTVSFSHPDHSQTEVILSLDETSVVKARAHRVSGKSSTATFGPLSVALSKKLLKNPQFLDKGGKFFKEGENSWGWQVSFANTQISHVLRRFEIIVGRINLLMSMVASVEASFPCTLICDESSLMKETWVKSCVYGDVQEEEKGETLNIRLGNPSRITVSGGFCGLLSVQLINRARSEKVNVKFLLSLNFLSNIPIKIIAPGDKVSVDRQGMEEELNPFFESLIKEPGTASSMSCLLQHVCGKIQSLLWQEETAKI